MTSNLAVLPLMARLARHRRRVHITQTAIAKHLGVDRVTVYRWEAGLRSPHYLHALGYAHRLDHHIALRNGRHILAIDGDIPAAFPHLRNAAGLTVRQYGARLHIIGPAITAAERRGYELLSSYERAVRGLDLDLDLRRAHEPAVAHA